MAIPALLGLAAKAAIGVGVASGAVGAKKIKNSKDSIESSKREYDEGKENFDKIESKTMKEVENLGKLKLEIWEDFDRFVLVFEKIKNKPEFIKSKDGEYKLDSIELKEIKGVSVTAVEVLKSGVLSAGAGAAVGMATYTAVMSFGAASTGAAIAGLSGVAATNATLAWLGGGAIAAGGGGMAAGSALLGTVVAGPAAVIGGFFLNSKGNESEDNAYNIRKEVNDILEKFEESEEYLLGLDKLSKSLRKELKRLYNKYIEQVSKLEYIVEDNNNYNDFTDRDRTILDNNIKLVGLLKNLTDIELTEKSDDEEVLDILNTKPVKMAIKNSKEQVSVG